jgi:hypothetical protein
MAKGATPIGPGDVRLSLSLEIQSAVDAADVAAEARGFTRGVNAVIDVLRGYRGAVSPMSAVSDAKRLLEKPRTP